MEKKTVFIRHNLGGDPKKKDILKKMWDDKVIVLDYEAKASSNPDDYEQKNSRKAIRRLNEYCNAGVIVGADFRQLYSHKMLVGEIEKGAQIQIKEYGGYKFYKVVELKKVKEVSYLKYPILLSLQPRSAAITGWDSAKNVLEAALEGKLLPLSVYSLDANQLEVLCYEYLKHKGLIGHLLLPIGRTLRDIDIYGCDKDGKNILAQVTFSSEIDEKKNKLKEFNSKENKLYFFCPRESMDSKDEDISFIAIEAVFDEFKEATFLKKMLGHC